MGQAIEHGEAPRPGMGHEASLEESARRRRREPRVCRERAGDELTEALVRDAEHTCARNTLEGVSSACVFGVPDERFGELVACALAADARFSASSARALLERSLVPHARPRRLAVFDSLPHLPNGKLDRVAVKRLAAERLEPWSSPASRPDPQEGGP